MKFSVVMPLYNKQAFVAETLQAALSQTFIDFEIIIVDDGSTDESVSLVESFKDPRIILLRQKNAGVSAARNVAIQRARGEWVAFLDADDIWAPNYLAEQYSAVLLYPDVDMVTTRFYAAEDLQAWKTASQVIKIPERKIEWIINLPLRWMEGGAFFTSSVAVRRLKLDQMQPCFTVGDSNGEDLELWFRLAESTPIVLTLSPLAGYRLATPNSLRLSQTSQEFPPYLERMQKRVRTGHMANAQRRSSMRFITQHKINLARERLIAGDRAGGLEWLNRAVWRGVFIRRWWVSLAFAFFPGSLIGRFNEWRVRIGNARM